MPDLGNPVLIFDLDGTLTDPAAGLVNCVRYALSSLGSKCPSDEVLCRFIGPPLRPMFAALLDTSDTTLIEGAVALYRERYADVGLYETRLYEGIPAMLSELTQPAFVATSKPKVFAERVLEHLRLDRYFVRAYGPDLDGRLDDKSELLRYLLKAEKLTGHHAVMVGDRSADVVAAKANRVASIGVLWGYGSRDELIEAEVDLLCSAPRDIPMTVTQIRSRNQEAPGDTGLQE